jgi:hypothetical protein
MERKQETEYLSLFGEESKGYQESVEQQLSVPTNKTISSDELSPSIVQKGMDMKLSAPKIERKQQKEYLSLFGEEGKGHLESVEQQSSVQTNTTCSSDGVSPSIVQQAIEMEGGETSQESSQNAHEAYRSLYQLEKYYRDVHDVSLKNAFLSEGIGPNNRKLWTSTFICPVLGERFEAVKLPDTANSTELDGRYYYEKKKVAMKAAAIQAHVQLVQSKKFVERAVQTELELSYRHNHGGLFSVSDNSFEVRKEVSPSIVQQAIDMEGGETSQESSQNAHKAYQYHRQLAKYYRDVHDVSLKNAFLSEGIGPEDNKLWTSTFICPVLGGRFEAVKLPDTTNSTELDGRYYYGKKKVAMQAAAMQAHVQLVQSKKIVERAVRTELELWYRHNHGGLFSVSDNSFEVRKEYLKGEGVEGDWWTASFTCPASGEKYLAATLNDAHDARRDPDGSCTWYRERAEARAAAVSWVLDIKRFKETGMSEPRTCEEDPSTLDISSALTSTTTGGGMGQEQSLEDSLMDNFACRALIEWYQEHHGIVIGKDSFISTMSTLNVLDTGATASWWTSSFLCPVSGVRYDAGKLNEYTPDELKYDSEGGIWYKQEGGAVAAAASRAIECLRSVASSDEAVPASRTSQAKVDVTSTTIVLSTTSHEEDGRQADKTKAISGVDRSEETEHGYIMHNVSSSSRVQGLGYPQNIRRPTILGLIAETWADVSSPQVDIQDSSPRVGKKGPVMPGFINPVIARQKAIDTALQWVEKHRIKSSQQNDGKVRFDLDHGFVSLQIANMLLDSLATVAARLPGESRQSGVEVAATALVETMWLSKATQPNAETYASYLKCFEGDDHKSVALRAQEMLDAMNKETKVGGRILPHPKAVIRLWAHAGVSDSD